jgi:PBS lyase HEAT-like repeat
VRGKVRTPLTAPKRLVLEPAVPRRVLVSAVRRLLPRTLPLLAITLLAPFGLCGCAPFWDDVTSRDFEIRSLWADKPDPLVVLHDSNDGDKRAQALRAMLEPAQFGEPKEKQDAYVEALCKAAHSERTSLCRLAAIATLRNYKDPRVSAALQEAYYAASSYPPDTAAILYQCVLEALGQVGNPNAVDFLIKVVKEPPVAKGAEVDRQQLLEQRIAAARALGHFKQTAAAETLLAVLQKEKDPGMRNAATVALQEETGKRFPEDAITWEKYLHETPDKDTIFGEPSFSDKVWDVVNVAWWWK